MRLLLTTLFSLLLSIPVLLSQKLDFRLGYMIVQLEKDISPDALAAEYAQLWASEMTVDRALSGPMGIYLFKFDFATIHQGKLLDALRSDNRVAVAQY
jgi:hypothetical protein